MLLSFVFPCLALPCCLQRHYTAEAMREALETVAITDPDPAANPRGFTLARMRAVTGWTVVDVVKVGVGLFPAVWHPGCLS